MRGGAGLLCALPLLVGCSEPASPTTDARTSGPASPESSPTRPAVAPTEPAPASPSGGMTGQVSGLSGDRSDLNVRVTAYGTIVDLPSDALFDYDKSTLTPAAEDELLKVAALIRRSPPGPIQVIGHTDSHGEDAYNQGLSEARARTVAAWFARQVGVRQRAFQVSGKGETAPIARNETAAGADDPQGRTRNRRVEVVLPNA